MTPENKHWSPKGKFTESPPDTPEFTLDDSFADDVVKKGQGTALISDFFFMVIVGFWNTLKGFMQVSDSSTDSESAKTG